MNVMPNIPQLDQTQDTAFSFWCAGAPDAGLLVHSFSASEQLSSLTQVQIELASEDPNIDLQAVLDTPCTLTVHSKHLGLRHFSGVVAEVERGDEGFHRTMYSVTMLPMLHRLAHGSDCRIFQEKTADEIVKEVLKEYGIEDTKWHIADAPKPVTREYVVQYRETHLAFIERICAHEGIWFFFSHGKNGQHTLHFCNHHLIIKDLEDQPSLEYNSMSGGVVKGAFCHNFSFREKLRATSYLQREYGFKNPVYNQQHLHQRQEDNGSAKDYRLYDYADNYKKNEAGKPFTQYRMEATRVDASTASGMTNAIHLMPGYKMELTAHPRAEYNIKYHLLAVSHHGSQPQALGEEAGGEATTYSASFHAMPSTLPYRPPRRMKPVIDGPQIAHVTGPEGEEIHTDKYGRIKVWFPWAHQYEARDSAKDDRTSCWVRVSQNWGGAKWGHMAIPRVGHEVVIDFLEGDPDQPIAMGRTYHNNNMPPYDLPDHKTKMVIRSDSHKADGYNEISFEDEGGQENMFFHAQKDMTYKVLNNRAKRVENNQVESVGSNNSIDIGGNHAEKIGGSMNISVGGGSGGALLGTLGAVLAAGGKDSEVGSAATGVPLLGTFAAGITAAGALSESSSLSGKGTFNAAGEHFTEAGKAQQSTASKLGGIIGKIMPLSGIVSTVIEKFKTTTIGIGKTEQIGVYKNTTVGHTQTINVGKELIITVGKSKLIMDKDGNVTLSGTKFNFSASDHVEVSSKLIDLN